jgi:hypothetical protein
METKTSPEVRKTPWHIYPPDWKDSHWLVPYQGENALIRHGHTSPDDHSLCGPVLFCCAKSQQLFKETFPEDSTAGATWELTEADHIAAWLDAGVGVLYFIFCDPVRPKGLLSGGLSGDEAIQALYKRTPLEAYTERATRLR